MKNLILTFILLLVLATPALASDVQYFRDGFREKSEQGFWYFSSNHESVLVCGGAYITPVGHGLNVKCPSPYELASLRLSQGKWFTKIMEMVKEADLTK